MDTSPNGMQPPHTVTHVATTANGTVKIIYSAPASPVPPIIATPTEVNAVASSSAINPAMAASMHVVNVNKGASTTPASSSNYNPISQLCTPPKKLIPETVILHSIREKVKVPGGPNAMSVRQFRLSQIGASDVLIVIKDRYLLSSHPCQVSAAAAAKPYSYRHLIDLSCSNLKCTDIFTEEQYLCKVINEPLHKVQLAYFKLKQDEENCRSSIFGHTLIRQCHDIAPLSRQRSYVVVSPPTQREVDVLPNEHTSFTTKVPVYEDLHTYVRNKRRLGETEARALFHQICQTVYVCHRNGIILRDLKLKRFYFLDEARTKLQYESLEGSMILDDPNNDTLSDKIGCPLYTAPELLCPTPTYQGKPADMWSLGVILYTMLVGQYPFYEKGNCNLITIIRHRNVQIPSSLSRSVRWLLLTLLRKNHSERIQAQDIFLAPWLKEQRPYYMSIPADVILPIENEQLMGSQLLDEGAMKPLDYSQSSQRMECGDDDDYSDDNVEMG